MKSSWSLIDQACIYLLLNSELCMASYKIPLIGEQIINTLNCNFKISLSYYCDQKYKYLLYLNNTNYSNLIFIIKLR